jgi:hypothetical protein
MVLHTKEVLPEVFEKYIHTMLLQMASGSCRRVSGDSIEPLKRSLLPRIPHFSWMNGGRVPDNIIFGYERSV